MLPKFTCLSYVSTLQVLWNYVLFIHGRGNRRFIAGKETGGKQDPLLRGRQATSQAIM